MTEQKSKEQLEKDWWLKWYEADYSWEGLAKKDWIGWAVMPDGRLQELEGEQAYIWLEESRAEKIGGRQATLQDYWRDQIVGKDGPRPLLTAPNGKHYTRVHFPMVETDGITPTEKADWPYVDRQKLHDILKAKLPDYGDTAFALQRRIKGPDNRTQLQGGVFLDFDIANFDLPTKPNIEPELFPISCLCSQSFFYGDASFNKAAFSGYADFNKAAFSGYADFSKAAFSGGVSYSKVAFSGGADFSKAAFSGSAYFREAAFSGYAYFSEAAFSGYAYFSEAAFSGIADFSETAFSGDAYFRQATFSDNADFRQAAFSGDIYFSEAAFLGYASFGQAGFSGYAVFDEAAFSEGIYFRNAAFLSHANFEGRARELKKDDEQWSLSFDGKEDGATGQVNLPGAILPKAYYSFASFDFSNAVVMGDCSFQNRDFLGRTSFEHTKFGGVVEFQGGSMHQGVSFFGAQFEYILQSHAANPASIKIDKYKSDIENFDSTMQAHHSACMLIVAIGNLFQKEKKAKVSTISYAQFLGRLFDHLKSIEAPSIQINEKEESARHARIERAFRKLKLSMEEIRNKTQEQEFYRMELLARRRRRDDQVPKWEYQTKPFIWLKYLGLGKSKLANWSSGGISHAFEWASDFGGSIQKPLVHLLFVALAIGAMTYLLMILQSGLPDICFCGPDPRIGQAFGFSISNIFPFGGYGEARDLLLKADAGTYSWSNAIYGLIATAQSLFSLIMVFLSGLAIRRRFQIS